MMKFIKTEVDQQSPWSNWICRHVSEGGGVHVGVCRVIYGYRVRAGYTDDNIGCSLDWCGGADWDDVQRLYSLCIAVLSRRNEPEDDWRKNHVFDGVPGQSNIKPFYLDREFVERVIMLAGNDVQLITLEKPSAVDINRSLLNAETY